jgi:hypothetical protein
VVDVLCSLLSQTAVPSVCRHSSARLARMADLIVFTTGSRDQLYRPCVDCGKKTGNYCETLLQVGKSLWQGGVCLADENVPSENWAPHQRTPLCTDCERVHGACHFCRGVHLRTPRTMA